MTEKNRKIGVRLGAMLLDHLIMTFVIGISTLIITGIGYLIIKSIEPELPEWFPAIPILTGILFFSLYFNKDAIKGKSPAKRILGFIIVDNKTGEVANPIKTVIRNITLILWPIEVIFSLFSPERRIGDYIAGTKVIDDNGHLKTELKIGQIFIAIFIGLFYMFLIVLMQFIGNQQIDIFELLKRI